MDALRFISLGAVLAAPAIASGQRFSPPERPLDTYRMAAGGSVSYGLPVGEFQDYVDHGWGLDAFFRWNADPHGILSLRLDGGFVEYGSETKRFPLLPGTGRITVKLTTSNNIAWMGVGPQLTIPTPFMQPYVNASAGFSYFFTESSVAGSSDNTNFADTQNYDDGTFAWGVGGGFLIPFHTRKANIALDLGVRYHGNGQVSYLRKGGIEDLPGGQILLHPIQSEANLLTYRLGVSVLIP